MDARDDADGGEGSGAGARSSDVDGRGGRSASADGGGADTLDRGCFASAAKDLAHAYGDPGEERAADAVLPGMDSRGAHAGRADHSSGGEEVQGGGEADRVAARSGGNVFNSPGRAGGSEHAGSGF